MARPHDPAGCVACTELPHITAYGLPIWAICDQLGITIAAAAKHVRDHPDLADRLSDSTRDAIRRADSADRHTRSTRPKENAA